MGAKYYPTIKDQKASQRFQQKQRQQQSTKSVTPPNAAVKPVKKQKAE